MDTLDKMTVTTEGVWVDLQESKRFLTEMFAESERLRKESDERNERLRKESDERNDRLRKELDERYDRRTAESRAAFEKEMSESRTEFKERIKVLNEMIGGMANSNGMVAEEFFVNVIENGDKFLFGVQFDECHRYARRYDKSLQKKGEVDTVLTNCDSIAIIEIKYKARREDIKKAIDKLPDFRLLFPQYKSHRIYLGLAALAFDKGVEAESEREGVALLKQVGDALVVNDKHMKAF